MRSQCNQARVVLERGLALAIWILLLGPAWSPAQATTIARMDLGQLTAHAAAVARVRCLSSASRLEAGSVWTVSTFEVVEVWKGRLAATIVVRLPGGRASGLHVRVEGAPRFVPGEEEVLFLEPALGGEMTITSWAQGTFRIRRSAPAGDEVVTQDTAGMRILDPVTGNWSSGGIERLPLTRLRDRVAEAVRRSN
jgi:hypothetical protein